MTARSSRDVVLEYIDAMNASDWDRLRRVLHPDYVEDYPQSAERVRGAENAIAIRRHYPAEASQSIDRRLVGGAEQWVLAPNFTAIRVTGDGDVLTAIVRARYPDGFWYVITVAEVEGEQIRRVTAYFAPHLDAPEWRKELVEPLEVESEPPTAR
jgi:hypothetical protein